MLKKSIAILLSVGILAGSVALAGCSRNVNKRPDAVEKETSIKLKENGNIRVLQLTDLHMTKGSSKKADKETLRWVRQAVAFARADVVAVTGDAVAGLAGGRARDKALIELAEIFEKAEVYWMYTFGNHDGEWSYETGTQVGLEGGMQGREELYDLLKGYKYSLMQKGDTDGIGNYVIDVVNDKNETVYSFINMDSHGKLYDKDGNDVGYLGLTENQVKWYEKQVNEMAKRTADGKVPQSTLFMHVPLVEYTDAWENYPQMAGFNEVNLEGKVYSQPAERNTGCYEKIKELGSTSLVSVGHDHDFNWLRNYNGVLLSYGRVSGIDAWCRRAPVGATVIDINTKADSVDTMYKITVIEPSFKYSPYTDYKGM